MATGVLKKRRPRRAKRPAGAGYPMVTAFRLPETIVGMATKKAAKMGLSRNKYVEQVLRKDLGLEGVDLDALERTSVFG